MIARALLVLGLGTAPARADDARDWTVALELAMTIDRAATSDRGGPVSLHGSGLGLHVSAARRVRASRWYAHGALTLRAVGNVTRAGTALPEAALLEGSIGAGVAWRPGAHWWASATLGPMLAAYVSPRVLGVTELGASLELAAARSFSLSRVWELDAVGRGALGVLPDGAQTWLAASLGVGIAARARW